MVRVILAEQRAIIDHRSSRNSHELFHIHGSNLLEVQVQTDPDLPSLEMCRYSIILQYYEANENADGAHTAHWPLQMEKKLFL